MVEEKKDIFVGDMVTATTLNPMTCVNCGKKLAEVKIKDGTVSVKCKCGTINVITTSTTKSSNSQ